MPSTVTKTPMMKWFELRFGESIEDLLKGSLTECARRLGTNKSTISKWKKRLGLDQQYLQEHTYQPNEVDEAWAEEARLEALYGDTADQPNDEDPNVEAVA